jgi:type I restriction enzyme S subunit
VVSPEFPVFEPKGVIPEVLDAHFKSPSVWAAIAGLSKGTNVRRRRLHPERFLEYVFPLPDEETQRHIRDAYKLINDLHALHNASSNETQALGDAMIYHTLNAFRKDPTRS